MADITLNDLESALSANNIEPGSITVRDGYYEYNIKFSTLLRTPEDVQNIYIRKNDRIFQIKDLAKVAVVPEKETGLSLANGKRAVTLAVIKQADENMDNMKEALAEVTDYFKSIYPDIEFTDHKKPDRVIGLYDLQPQAEPIVRFLIYLHRGDPFPRGRKKPGGNRTKYGSQYHH